MSSIIEQCASENWTIGPDQCFISFNGTAIERFGETGRNQFEGNPDIAGLGVLIAFTVPSGIALLISLYYCILRGLMLLPDAWNFSSLLMADCGFTLSDPFYSRLPSSSRIYPLWERSHKWLDGFILSFTDAQLLLLLAFGAAFKAASKCDISLYHYLIVSHTTLIGICTSITAGYIVRRYYFEKLLTAWARVVITGICLFTMSQFKDAWSQRDALSFFFDSNIPSRTQANSVVILPAFCFLDSDAGLGKGINPSQLLLVGNFGLPRHLGTQLRILGFLWGFQALYLLFCSIGTLRRFYEALLFFEPRHPNRKIPDQHTQSPKWQIFFCIFIPAGIKLVAWAFCVVFSVWNWLVIVHLRSWANQSVWLQREDSGQNVEDDMKSIGQLAPLIALAAVAFSILDKTTEKVQKWGGWTVPQNPGNMSESQDNYTELC